MRWNELSSDFANAFASVVLPMPGTSSSSTCPSHSSATSSSSTVSSLPTMTRATLALIRLAVSATCAISVMILLQTKSLYGQSLP